MKVCKIPAYFLISVGLGASPQAGAGSRDCAGGLTTNVVRFETEIQYDDIQSKANPTVYVLVNGKRSKMMLDTGTNKNLLWDDALLDEEPGALAESVDSHVASADARIVNATLTDDHGNSERTEFYLVSNSVLAAAGYSGVLSPQAVAAHHAVILDFDRDCIFTSAPFDIGSVKEAQIRRGTTIQNPYDVMAIRVEINGRDMPLLVDSGATHTTILSSLISFSPKGPESPRMKDLFGAELPEAGRMRLVDLKVNGRPFTAHPVIPAPSVSNKGIENVGYLGMDVLKEQVIYYDGARREFNVLTRRAVVSALSERESRAK